MSGFVQLLLVSILVLLAGTALGVLVRRYRAGASERRLRAMMRRLGVEANEGAADDYGAVIQAVRRRCRKCRTVAECEAWMADEQADRHEFCPNARVFDILMRYREEQAGR